jgi:ferredoxin-NADP reductase
VTTITTEYEAQLVVESKKLVCDGVALFSLRRPDGADLPRWTAGAHIDLNLQNGLTRQYSLCGDPDDRCKFRIAVLREAESRGGSQFLHEALKIGDVISIKGPRNNFSWVPAANFIFIAGGIGITPILPMLRTAETHRANWRLLYGGRRRSSMAFLDELACYGDRVTVAPQDEVGVLDLASILRAPQAETLVYCCGPESLLAAVELQCGAWPGGALHTERFKPRKHNPTRTDRSFEVELRRSGRRLTVPPDKTILQVIEGSGLIVASSCLEGICGTCEVAVIDGVPDHRDSILCPEVRDSNRAMMICVSRSWSDLLVLDM